MESYLDNSFHCQYLAMIRTLTDTFLLAVGELGNQETKQDTNNIVCEYLKSLWSSQAFFIMPPWDKNLRYRQSSSLDVSRSITGFCVWGDWNNNAQPKQHESIKNNKSEDVIFLLKSLLLLQLKLHICLGYLTSNIPSCIWYVLILITDVCGTSYSYYWSYSFYW